MSEPAVAETGRGTTTLSLPPDMLLASTRRVGLAALIMAVVWVLVVALNFLQLALYPQSRLALLAWPMPGLAAAATGTVLSLLLAWAARHFQDRPTVVLNLGLGFEVVTGLLIAILTQWHPVAVPMRVSWVCVLVVVYPTLAPFTLRRAIIAALLTVSMDPLIYLLVTLRGGEASTSQQIIWMFAPNFLSAGLAIVPATVIRRLGREMKRARELGSYRLGTLLGQGGMGEVYRAEHRLLARPAAIKLIRADMLAPGEPRRVAIERFRREAQAAALLQSPHTIALFDYGATGDGAFYYAMELLDGPSFEQLVERFGPLPAERAVYLLRQVCESIAEAHANGLVHRDIKPSNLTVTRLGLDVDFVKVLDFGMVKFGGPARERPVTLTAPDMAAGTPAFMAPEAAMGERGADHRIDIYSLGCVAYWLLTGQLVFDSDSAMKVMMQHISDDPVPPSRRTELPVPPALEQLVMACLAKKPADRPAGAAELDELLAAVPLEHPWTSRRARRWWDEHLPPVARRSDHQDHGTLMPQVSGS